MGTLWKELVWVASPTKYGGVHIQYVDYWNLLCPLPMAVGMLSLRYLLQRYCFAPLGEYLGIKATRWEPAPPDPVLEDVYRRRSLSHSQIVGVAKRIGMTERQVEKWLRRRRKQDRPTVLTKFCQTSWRCSYYCCMFVYGLVVLWKKPWLWDIKECWRGFPESLVITGDIWWYYMISMSFYWSLFIGQFVVDVKRKDFWQMFVHHLATILLMCFSWLAGVFRLGCLVLMVHDCADVFLEAAKVAKYADYHATCTAIFCFFTVVWVVTRLGIFPFWIIKHTLTDAMKIVPDFPAYYTFNGLLLLLLALHCFWTYLILKVVAKVLGEGQVEGDVRSSSDDSSEDN
ncbi:hypothetical protein MTP99_006383 [Tenebrio molitor]|nr:hypothetical protein MTP99_006383 [Tenebrio molitor]